MVTLNNEAIKEIRKIIEKEGNPFNAGEYIYEYINSIFPCDNLTFSIRATKESLKAIFIQISGYICLWTNTCTVC
jgi:hypothetical protein